MLILNPEEIRRQLPEFIPYTTQLQQVEEGIADDIMKRHRLLMNQQGNLLLIQRNHQLHYQLSRRPKS